MNLKATASPPLKMTLVLESLSSGQISASILEFPHCRVEADTKEAAIAKIRPEAIALLSRIEVMPLEISPEELNQLENPWVKYAGMFENDPDFAAIAAAIRAEREIDDDSEVDPAVYALEG
jgi:hypothetical protein